MALGRRNDERQQELWIATPSLPLSPGHAFYGKLNELLAEGGFDEWVEKLCEAYYAKAGRPGIPPGVSFRMLLVGYFEGIGSQRGIAWQCSDSLSLRKLLGLSLTEPPAACSSTSTCWRSFCALPSLPRPASVASGRHWRTNCAVSSDFSPPPTDSH